MDAIEANYVPDGNDWTITVTGRGKTLTGTAPGIIAARDRADQLVEKIAPSEKLRTVVHMLSGDAVAFTSAYLSARMAKPTEPEHELEPVVAEDAVDAEVPTEEPLADAVEDEAEDENDDGEDDETEPAEAATPDPAAKAAATSA